MTMRAAVPLLVSCGMAATGTAGVASATQTVATDAIVVMGCVTQVAAGDRQAGTASTQPQLVITDTRSKPPRRFVLNGSMDALAWHVGHTLEVRGRVGGGKATDAAARDAQLPVLDVEKVIYMQPTCEAALR